MTDDERILIAKAIPLPTSVDKLSDAEFSVFSQWGDDGIIRFLTKLVPVKEKFFIEFGVEDYQESNTRYLMMDQNWSGLILDGSENNVKKIRNSPYYWKHDLIAQAVFVTIANITSVISKSSPSQIGLLHIDIDGMDYWIWEELSKTLLPDIVILEYNSVFGKERNITVPYSSEFERFKEHHSGLYAGASLGALVSLSEKRGYDFVGCNSAGNNAYFIKKGPSASFAQSHDDHRRFPRI